MATSAQAIPHTIPLPGGIPDTHRPHTEQTTTILVPKENTAFLNPVQEYNRDLSVASIRTWNQMRLVESELRWRKRLERDNAKGKKKAGKKGGAEGTNGQVEAVVEGEETPAAGSSTEPQFRPSQFTILEALSATGLRSIRYAKEIPDVKTVLANDLSPAACEAMHTNVAMNGVGENISEEDAKIDVGRREGCEGRVVVNEGDACTLMYSRRAPRDRVQVVDLDPYGTAAPFIDSAIGSIADGGLLCITCTDLAVLAGTNWPEKCFSNYGGLSIKSEASHEVALRLVINSLAQSAARYGRTITPLLSLSIDFYVRLFIRVDTSLENVKKLASQTGIVYVCTYCQSPTIQPFGKTVEKENKNGDIRYIYRPAQGPTATGMCAECNSPQHVAGPMWLGPIHDRSFVGALIQNIEKDKEFYSTYPRMHGMLTLAHEEIEDPLYFTANKLFGLFRSAAGPNKSVFCALLNAGYNVSRSHASPGSIKTNAPRSFIFDIIREHIKKSPIRLDNVAENSPVRALVSKEMTHTIDFTFNEGYKQFEKPDKVSFYPLNPLPNWGPGTRARDSNAKSAQKRKSEEVEGEASAKKVKAEPPVEEVEEVENDEEAAMNA